MQRRATSKKRAAEVEKEINMDDKEATPVGDIEEILPPAEPEQPKQPERPARTGDVSLQEIMRVMMENNKRTEDSQKKMEESLKELKEDS